MAAKRKRRNKSYSKRRNLTMSIVAIVVVFIGIITLNSYNNFSSTIPTWNSLFNETQQNDSTLDAPDDGDMSVSMLSVGQADASLISVGEKHMLIDGGEIDESTKIISELNERGVKTIDIIIATHQHADHIGGLAQIIDMFEVDKIIMPKLQDSLVPTSKTYENLLNAISRKGLSITPANVGDVYKLGDATVDILGPTQQFDNLNDMSVVAKITYGQSEFLFTGDAEDVAERSLVESGADIDCDVLSVGHHGSSTSTTKEFLEATTPQFAGISCGIDNSYGHPHEQVLRILDEYDVEVYRTDLMGTIEFTTDGNNITVDYENK